MFVSSYRTPFVINPENFIAVLRTRFIHCSLVALRAVGSVDNFRVLAVTVVSLHTLVLDGPISIAARHRTLRLESFPTESAVGIALLVVVKRLRRVAAVAVGNDNFRVQLVTRCLTNLFALTQAAAVAPVLHLPDVLFLRRWIFVVVVVVADVIRKNDLLGVRSCVRELYYVIVNRWGWRVG